MQDSQINNDATCLLCCEQRDIFILPKCNHKHICWRCCINMIKQGKFGCPFCKSSVNQKEKVIFVTFQEMMKYSYTDALKSHNIELLKSSKNTNYFYSNQFVAEKIEYETSYNCPYDQCQQLFDSLNQIKKHLDIKHKKQYCDICLNNRKCIHSEQILYSEAQYQKHIKNGEFSENGDLILFHPTCTFCKQTLYDIDEFRRHLELTHQKCFICHKGSEQLKYVYFNNYQQAVEHFKKSHFYCEISTCMGTKFENVFVTQEAYNQHVLRVHKKAKKNNQPIMNMMLGFNKTQQQSLFDWDKIGKNFANIFQKVQKSSTSIKLQAVDHENIKIDIRDFYPQLAKKTLNLSLNKIKEKIQDKMFESKYRDVELYIDDVDFFKPLEMPPLTKVELQKFLSSIFDKKICEPIVNKFFAGRQDFSSTDQYFSFVKDKMKSYSKIAFYHAFPQLVRFYKNDNPHKQLMDQYYYQSLLELKVRKPFIIHTKLKYTQVLQFMKYLIQKQIQQRDEDSQNISKQLDIQKYLSFLKDSSLTYYVKHQEDIFYVSKQKITNLYHMVNKCKVQDFLKMNWLLKVGFSNQAYKIIWKEFYYREEFDCYHAIKKLNIQELAYLYAYSTICLESIFEKNVFRIHKEKPLPLFLSQILGKIKRTSTHQRIQQIVQLQKKFLKSDHIVSNKDKGIIINMEQHPSLLDRNIDVLPFKSKPPDSHSDFPTMAAFGTIRPKLWHGESGGSTVKGSKNSGKTVEDYPSILTNTGKNKKFEQKIQQEQFPVFHYVGKKQKKDKTANQGISLNEALGWVGSGFVSSKWNQQTSLKNWQKRQQDQKRRIARHQQIQQETIEKPKIQQKIEPTAAKVKQILPQKKNKIKKGEGKIEAVKQIKKPIKEEPMVFVVSKKANKIDEQQESFQQTKKKNKQKKNKQKQPQKKPIEKVQEKKKVQKEQQQQCGLFQKIEKQSKIILKKIKQQTKLQNFFESIEINKPEEKQKISSKSSYLPANNYQAFEKGDFPQLQIVKPIKIEPKLNNQSNKQKQQKKPLKIEQKKKKRKMRADDTSSQDQKADNKVQHKKSEDFVSISDKFQKVAQQKVSKVNQIIQNAKPEQKPQNLIQVKKNKKGKKQIIQSVSWGNW